MTVIKYYEYYHPNEKYIKISCCKVIYFENDMVRMTGYFNSDDILDVARIIKGYKLKLTATIRNGVYEF